MSAFFAAVSFAEGELPPYERLHDLFVPGGLLINNTGETPEIAGVDEFIAPRRRAVEAGELTSFEEYELGAAENEFGGVAARWSRYAKRGMRNGTPFEGEGAITTQFVRTPDGWRISAMAWDDER